MGGLCPLPWGQTSRGGARELQPSSHRPCIPHPALLWGGFRAFELLLSQRPGCFIPPVPVRLPKAQRGEGGSVGLSHRDQVSEPRYCQSQIKLLISLFLRQGLTRFLVLGSYKADELGALTFEYPRSQMIIRGNIRTVV